MKKITLVFITGFFVTCTLAQTKNTVVVSISAGALTSPYYLENKLGTFYNLDFDYHLSRGILSVNYNHGSHAYYDNVLSNEPYSVK